MRKVITILLFSFLSSLIYGQQLPQYSLYMLNEVIINPAALSKEKDNKIATLLGRYKKMLEFGEEPEKEGKEDTKEGMLNSYNNSNYN